MLMTSWHWEVAQVAIRLHGCTHEEVECYVRAKADSPGAYIL